LAVDPRIAVAGWGHAGSGCRDALRFACGHTPHWRAFDFCRR
jgi:hypothetical protein